MFHYKSFAIRSPVLESEIRSLVKFSNEPELFGTYNRVCERSKNGSKL